jgi:hypothetical protein
MIIWSEDPGPGCAGFGVYTELRAYYSEVGHSSIDPVLMIQMLIIGHNRHCRSLRTPGRDVDAVETRSRFRREPFIENRLHCQFE